MNIYVVLFKTNTKIGRFLRIFLRFKYNHVSICLDEEYSQLYSFSRRYSNLPFVGGFVREDLYHMFGKKESIDIRVFKIPVSNEKVKNIIEILNKMQNDKDGYIYNLASIVFTPLNFNIEVYKAFNCSQFVAKILSDSKTIELDKEYYKYTPKDLDFLLKDYKMMELTLYKKNFEIQNENYNRKFSIPSTVIETVFFIFEVFKRILIFQIMPHNT